MRRILPFLLAAVLMAASLLALPVHAQSDDALRSRFDAREVQAILGDLGYTGSEIDADDDIIVRMHGYRVLIMLGSYEGQALLARFALAGTGATVDDMNAWNRDMRFSRAYIDAEGDPVLESDLDLEHGATRAQVMEFLQTWGESLGAFLRQLPGEDEPRRERRADTSVRT